MSTEDEVISPWCYPEAAIVLRLVLENSSGWDPDSICSVRSVCQVWRGTIDECWLSLVRRSVPTQLRYIDYFSQNTGLCWGGEWLLVNGCWKLGPTLGSASGVIQNCTLCPCGKHAALLLSSGQVVVLKSTKCWNDGEVAACYQLKEGDGEGGCIQWSHCNRLLVSRPAPLTRAWTVTVLQLREIYDTDSNTDKLELSVCSRARTAGITAGATGGSIWAGSNAFLTAEVTLLGPGCATTAFWINSTMQECGSEYSGVSAPLLRLYNEDDKHFTCMVVAETCSECSIEESTEEEESLYSRVMWEICTHHQKNENYVKWLIYACGDEELEGPNSTCTSICSVLIEADTPPEVRCRGSLKLRYERFRAERLLAPEPEEPLTPEAVRSLCTPPVYRANLYTPVLGIKVFPASAPHRCVWVCVSELGGGCGVRCLTAVGLQVLRAFCVGCSPRVAPPLYYADPSVNDSFIACVCATTRTLHVWSAVSGAECPRRPRTSLTASALLPPSKPRKHYALIPNGGHLQVWTMGDAEAYLLDDESTDSDQS